MKLYQADWDGIMSIDIAFLMFQRYLCYDSCATCALLVAVSQLQTCRISAAVTLAEQCCQCQFWLFVLQSVNQLYIIFVWKNARVTFTSCGDVYRHGRVWKEHVHQADENHPRHWLHGWWPAQLHQARLPEHLHGHELHDLCHGHAPHRIQKPRQPGLTSCHLSRMKSLNSWKKLAKLLRSRRQVVQCCTIWDSEIPCGRLSWLMPASESTLK